jgi:hypothetical protein
MATRRSRHADAIIGLVVLAYLLPPGATAQSTSSAPVPADQLLYRPWKPELNDDSWVLIEVWPAVRAVTLTAFFLDYSYEKNENLCRATHRVFERDPQKGDTSYRLCMSLHEARRRGYFRNN